MTTRGPHDPPPADPAVLHSTEATRTYPCPSCGGEFVFDIAGQQLRCQSCGNYHPINVANTPVRPHELQSAMQQLRIMQRNTDGPNVTGVRTVVCQNCGGSTEFVGSLTATKCPYCATPIQRDDVHNAPARLPVDGLLTFRIDDKHAHQLVQSWIAKRWFAPSDFKRVGAVGSFSSLYTAYFSYDAETRTGYTGERGDDRRVRTGRDSQGNPTYQTKTFWRSVSGTVYNSFTDMPVLANAGQALNRERIKTLEPWPVDQARSYAPEFIAGHLCRTYDKNAEEAFPEVRQVMEQTIDRAIRSDIGGDHQRSIRRRIEWKYLGFKHLLLPIWLFTVAYGNRRFQVYINGVTGKVSGDRPWSMVKIALAGLTAALVAAVLIVIVNHQSDQQQSTNTPTYPTRTTYGHYPTTSRYPTYPTTSAYPSEPAAPAYPTTPVYPSEPAAPVYPSYPSEPTPPAYPIYPNPSERDGN